jgi:[ribosomal protein S18]-alanine N-acetyltransferase
MNYYQIRASNDADEKFLWEMLYQAIYVPEGEPRPSKEILKNPEISQSLKNWGRRGDAALIATSGETPVGAVWIRLFDDTNKTYGFVDPQTPLLGMALLPEYRGKGIGTVLLEKILTVAKELGFEQVSLSVDPDNPALRLYERVGFKKIGIDGTSWDMLVKLEN